MRSVVLVVLAGCWTGSSEKPREPAPIANTAPKPQARADTVQRTQSGGVIQLDGDRDRAMASALAEMNAHCGTNNFTITQEGEEAIGQDALDGTPIKIVTAWRVHYVCNSSQ